MRDTGRARPLRPIARARAAAACATAGHRRDARPVASRSCVPLHSAGPRDRARPAGAARSVRIARPNERATRSAPSASQKHSLRSRALSLQSNTDPSDIGLIRVNSTVVLERLTKPLDEAPADESGGEMVEGLEDI